MLPANRLWLLALIPIGLGIVNLAAAIRSLRRDRRPRPPSVGGPLGVALLTVANGADNLAVYTPFFAATGAGQVAVTLAVFAVGVAVWCLAGGLLTRQARVTAAAGRYGDWILPAAFILIGLYVLHETNAPIGF
jgi:cadmium resistance protein CadD (predicted permease)